MEQDLASRAPEAHRTRRVPVGVALCVAALIVLAVPLVLWVRAHTDEGVRLTEPSQQVTLPAHTTYAVHVVDADNSGYDYSCEATDSTGRSLMDHDPPGSLGFSDENDNLDEAFDTGDGRLTISCLVDGESVSVRPLADDRAVLLGLVAAVALGSLGLVVLRGPRARSVHTAPDLRPALVTTLIGGGLVGMKIFTFVLELVAMRTVGRHAFGHRTDGMHWVSTWDHVVSMSPRLLVSALAAPLVALTWWLAWRRWTSLAWVAGSTTTALALAGLVWV